MPYRYSPLFYQYQRANAERSAARLLPVVLDRVCVESVLDVGCGAGAWVKVWRSLGVEDAVGVDGDYVDRSLLLIDACDFHARDITQPFDFGRQFDLVQCLEVGEHVPHRCGPALVDNLVRHGHHVLFSAAPPGQGGEDHINERPYEYWRELFEQHCYRPYDFIRPAVLDDKSIEPWYRFNVMLYVHDSAVDALPASVRVHRVADDIRIADISPPAYRMRKWLLRCLPAPAVTRLAIWKHRRAVAPPGG